MFTAGYDDYILSGDKHRLNHREPHRLEENDRATSRSMELLRDPYRAHLSCVPRAILISHLHVSLLAHETISALTRWFTNTRMFIDDQCLFVTSRVDAEQTTCVCGDRSM